MNDEELDFVLKCLQVNPDERSSAKDLLKHSYLDCEKWEVLRNFKQKVLTEEQRKAMVIEDHIEKEDESID